MLSPLKLKSSSVATIAAALLVIASLITTWRNVSDSSSAESTRTQLPVSTISTQAQGSNKGPGTSKRNTGDGYGTLYAGAAYRLSTDGCSSGELKFVKATSAGTNPDFLPNSTGCSPAVDTGTSIYWKGDMELPWVNSDPLYFQGFVIAKGSQAYPPIIGGIFELSAFTELWSDSTDSTGRPKTFLRFLLSYFPDLSEGETMATPSEILSQALIEQMISNPILIYRHPA